jgi:hypothetical protein
MKRIIVAVSVLALSACSYMPQRYSVSEDNTEALKKIGAGNINVGLFTKTAEFDNSCRVTAGVIEKPDNTGFEGYIQKALIEELKQAGMFDDKTPKVTLSGVVEKLSLSTWRTIYLSNWDIGVRLNSSNGKTVYITQHYEFNAGYNNLADCQQIADHFMQAVQKTLNKLITAPEFQSLVTP